MKDSIIATIVTVEREKEKPACDVDASCDYVSALASSGEVLG